MTTETPLADARAARRRREAAVTLPLDVVERVLSALDRYTEIEGTYGLHPGDFEAISLVEAEVRQVKERIGA